MKLLSNNFWKTICLNILLFSILILLIQPSFAEINNWISKVFIQNNDFQTSWKAKLRNEEFCIGSTWSSPIYIKPQSTNNSFFAWIAKGWNHCSGSTGRYSIGFYILPKFSEKYYYIGHVNIEVIKENVIAYTGFFPAKHSKIHVNITGDSLCGTTNICTLAISSENNKNKKMTRKIKND